MFAMWARFLPLLTVVVARTPEEVAENARWLVHEASWGTLSTLDASSEPVGDTLSFSDGAVGNSTGRLFFYLMGDYEDSLPAALTISQAALNSSCGSIVPTRAEHDPEDPRCGRLTATGVLKKVSGEDEALGKAGLFARHPQMAHWPASHDFRVHELVPSDIWILDAYGGGQVVKLSDFLSAKPKHTTPWEVPFRVNGEPWVTPPPYFRPAQRARWLVYHSIWGTVSTKSVHLHGAPWGNARSVADGVGANSTGLPVLYLPTPDPTALDVAADSHVTISLTEAALADRVSPKGICNGMDPEDPTCARIALTGTLRALTGDEVTQAEVNLGARHPLAPWLAHGGAHTGGQYFIIDLKSITFLDFYGGPAKVTVSEYLRAVVPHEVMV